MKHLKRKFLKAQQATSDVVNVLDSVTIEDHKKTEKFILENKNKLYAIIRTQDNQLIQAFEYGKENEIYFIPEPLPIVTYFDIGRQFYRHTEEKRINLFTILDKEEKNVYAMLDAVNGFFASAAISATFLFNSVESFINLKIKEDIQYPYERKGKTTMYNKDLVVRYLPFDLKIKDAMSISCNKSFHVEFASKFEIICRIKKLRDDIMHTKVNTVKKPNFYSPLIIELLEFDFESTLYCIRDFINYYEPNLIEECDLCN